MKKILYPKQININKYSNCINKIVEKFSREPHVVSIYQIGSVTTPGISDIDLLIVFKDNSSNKEDPRSDLNYDEKYLVVHRLFGTTVSDFLMTPLYSTIKTTKILYGDLLTPINKVNKNKVKELEIQSGFEYLIQFYISLSVQIRYKVLKVRPLLLHVKGLLIDLEYLGIENEKVNQKIDEILTIRENWFSGNYSSKLEKLVLELFLLLQKIFDDIFSLFKFYIPLRKNNIKISRNIKLTQSDQFSSKCKGIKIPAQFSFNSIRYFNLLNRLNCFEFLLPLTSIEKNKFLKDRIDHLVRIKNYNKQFLPHFHPLIPSLNYF